MKYQYIINVGVRFAVSLTGIIGPITCGAH